MFGVPFVYALGATMRLFDHLAVQDLQAGLFDENDGEQPGTRRTTLKTSIPVELNALTVGN